MTQTEAARINGAKSHGPVTPEGKARSARNAMTHGLNSSDVLIAGEDPAAFEALLASLHECHHPVTPAEADLVFEIAANRWRLRRIRRMERAAIDAEISKLVNDPENPLAPEVAEAVAFANMAAGSTLQLLHRYESRLRRSCEKAEKELNNLAKTNPEPVVLDDDCMQRLLSRSAEKELQNEPRASPDTKETLVANTPGAHRSGPPQAGKAAAARLGT